MSATIEIVAGDCLDLLAKLPPNSIDAVCTDPPYGLEFMGKAWDAPWRSSMRNAVCETCGKPRRGKGRCRCAVPQFDTTPAEEAYAFQRWTTAWAREALRVLKPGGHLVAFGGGRTYHRLVVGVEDAGFEIRDQIDWIYGTGFPKSIDVEREIAEAECTREGRHFMRTLPELKDQQPGDHVCASTSNSRAFEGFGSALKPAHEPIVLARKPISDTIAATVLKYGTGGLNIDATRIGDGDGRWPTNLVLSHAEGCRLIGRQKIRNTSGGISGNEPSRPGLNTYGDFGQRSAWKPYGDASGLETVETWACAEDCPIGLLNEQSGQSETPESVGRGSSSRAITLNGIAGKDTIVQVASYGDAGGASRYFPTFRYEGKPARSERDAGLEYVAATTGGQATGRKDGSAGTRSPRAGAGRKGGARNVHPTVKPIALIRWLLRLIAKPGDRVLEPFTGSGTTPIACKLEGMDCVAFEREPDYVALARQRVAAAQEPALLAIAEDLEDEPEAAQGGLFDEPESIPPDEPSTERPPVHVSCANGHEWSNPYSDDWTPDRGTPCDCGATVWGGSRAGLVV